MTTEGDGATASLRAHVAGVLPKRVKVTSVDMKSTAGLALVYLTLPTKQTERQRLTIVEGIHNDLAAASTGYDFVFAPIFGGQVRA